jgi:ABC-type lipoprotein export system ATPase subunit
MNSPVCRLASATVTFGEGPSKVVAVDRATLAISQGESVGILGPSGSGKTTLLNLLGTLKQPTSGEVFFQERNVKDMVASERRRLRLAKIGFVFQQLRLIPILNAVENIGLPMVFSAAPSSLRRSKVSELVAAVGLSGKEHRRPGQLSLGEQQRVAVARALVNDPLLVLADEPTNQLDSSTGLQIVELILALHRKLNSAVVISTHDAKVCEKLDRIYNMRDGVLYEPRAEP